MVAPVESRLRRRIRVGSLEVGDDFAGRGRCAMRPMRLDDDLLQKSDKQTDDNEVLSEIPADEVNGPRRSTRNIADRHSTARTTFKRGTGDYATQECRTTESAGTSFGAKSAQASGGETETDSRDEIEILSEIFVSETSQPSPRRVHRPMGAKPATGRSARPYHK